MTSWLSRRLAISVILVFVLTSVVFFVVRLAPGDPLQRMVNETTQPGDRDLVRERLGLDGSLGRQYVDWLAGVVRGDLGISLRQQRPVTAIIGEAVGPTLLLTVTAYLLHLVLAVLAGTTMASRRGRPADHLLQGVGLVLYSLPGFWLGLMLIMFFAGRLGWFPVGAMHAPDAVFMSGPARLADLLHHLALPVATLALGSFMGTARYLRASLDEALAQDYIMAARARGLTERTILWRHALPNALLPLVTLIGLHLPFLLGGAVVVEVVFGWPGMGRVTVEALWARDYPVIVGTTLLSAITVVAGSLLADILYRRVDPRVRPGAGGGA
ncbi:diguanylate cyclase [bacterium]|nr:MAG: diguanylate cyclase [bacterium]